MREAWALGREHGVCLAFLMAFDALVDSEFADSFVRKRGWNMVIFCLIVLPVAALFWASDGVGWALYWGLPTTVALLLCDPIGEHNPIGRVQR